VGETRHFALEMAKLAFSPAGMTPAPPILSSALGKTTKGVVAKPLTTLKVPQLKTPESSSIGPVKVPGAVKGIKMDPARSNPSPPPIRGGTNVR
jgi:hypothetical protein